MKKDTFHNLKIISKKKAPQAGYRELAGTEKAKLWVDPKLLSIIKLNIKQTFFYDLSKQEDAILLIGESLDYVHVPLEAKYEDCSLIVKHFVLREIGFNFKIFRAEAECLENKDYANPGLKTKRKQLKNWLARSSTKKSLVGDALKKEYNDLELELEQEKEAREIEKSNNGHYDSAVVVIGDSIVDEM